jgi:hypothetical protein
MSEPRRQRWLVLAHAFNMDGRAASQTITDKIPHLLASGIDLVVLSGVSGSLDRMVDHHQLWPLGPAGIKFELRYVLRKRFKNPWAYRSFMALTSLALLPGIFIEKLFWRVESSWSWWISAYLKGLQLSRQQPFDLIYSTGGAFAAHLAGIRLKNRLAIPWLAEVHDPLIIPGTQPVTAQQKMQAHVEGLICRDADVAIWFTDQALNSAKTRHPELGNRGHVLLPGMDPPFKILPPYHSGPKMLLGHFGSLSSSRNLVPLIEALELLESQQSEIVALTELHVYGGPLDAASASKLASPALPVTVKNAVKHFGRIERDPKTGLSGREQILSRMRSMDVLLLLHGLEPICSEYIPSKLYEYLWMQRPILAMVHLNEQMANLLREQGHIAIETSARHNPVDELAQQIEIFFEQWRSQGLIDNRSPSPYTTLISAYRLIKIALQVIQKSTLWHH